MKQIIQNKRLRNLVISILLLIGLFVAYRAYKVHEVSQYKYWQVKGEIKSYQFIKDKQGIVVQWDYEKSEKEIKEAKDLANDVIVDRDFHSIVGERFIITQDYRLKSFPRRMNASSGQSKFLSTNIPENGEYWNIDVYDTKSKNLEKKTYDIFKLTREYNKDYIPFDMAEISTVTGIYTDQGHDYLPVVFVKKGDKKKKKPIFALLDLEKGKFVEKTVSGKTDINIEYPYQEFKLQLYNLPALDDKLEANNISYMGEYIFFTKGFDKTASSLLAKKEPKAYELIKSGEHNIFYLLGDKRDISYKIQMIKLGFPEGSNIFKDVTIPAENSQDGKEHVIQNEEEFLRYYKAKISEDFLKFVQERKTK